MKGTTNQVPSPLKQYNWPCHNVTYMTETTSAEATSATQIPQFYLASNEQVSCTAEVARGYPPHRPFAVS